MTWKQHKEILNGVIDHWRIRCESLELGTQRGLKRQVAAITHACLSGVISPTQAPERLWLSPFDLELLRGNHVLVARAVRPFVANGGPRGASRKERAKKKSRAKVLFAGLL